MRKTNSLVFFLNPSKKRKKVPARSKSLHARALLHANPFSRAIWKQGFVPPYVSLDLSYGLPGQSPPYAQPQ